MPASSAFEVDHKVHLVILIQFVIPGNLVSLVNFTPLANYIHPALHVHIYLQEICKHMS